MNAPSDSKIGELLAKLQELDPDAYMAWCELFDEIYDIDYDCIEWDSFAGAIYLLQGVIQDAISEINENGEGREWEFAITVNQMSFGPIYSVGVWSHCGGELWEGEGRTPAEALLAAYVAALEAEAQG